MATDPRRLRPSELCRLLNSTPLGEVISERQLYRHRTRAGLQIGDARHLDLLRYVAWLVSRRHSPKPELDGDPYQAVKGADVVYTDTWISMGQEAESAPRIAAMQPYQVNSRLIDYAGKDAAVMHCLPAHRGQEITNEVADGTHSLIFLQAENRLHAQKAILVELLG